MHNVTIQTHCEAGSRDRCNDAEGFKACVNHPVSIFVDRPLASALFRSLRYRPSNDEQSRFWSVPLRLHGKNSEVLVFYWKGLKRGKRTGNLLVREAAFVVFLLYSEFRREGGSGRLFRRSSPSLTLRGNRSCSWKSDLGNMISRFCAVIDNWFIDSHSEMSQEGELQSRKSSSTNMYLAPLTDEI